MTGSIELNHALGTRGRGSAEAFQIHAFTSKLHGGNPAGVCILDAWLDDAVLARIAGDFGPSVTAFVVQQQDGPMPIRWFTRTGSEVMSFCGHATFAAAHALKAGRDPQQGLAFESRSGRHQVGFIGDDLTLAIPRWDPEPVSEPPGWLAAVGGRPQQQLLGFRDAVLVYRDAAEIRALHPDFEALRQANAPAVIATAPGQSEDAVFRFFCPSFPIGEDEDLATGSALCTLTPYWGQRLAKSDLSVVQLSERGGAFQARLDVDGVVLRSTCVTFLAGALQIDDSAPSLG